MDKLKRIIDLPLITFLLRLLQHILMRCHYVIEAMQSLYLDWWRMQRNMKLSGGPLFNKWLVQPSSSKRTTILHHTIHWYRKTKTCLICSVYLLQFLRSDIDGEYYICFATIICSNLYAQCTYATQFRRWEIVTCSNDTFN